MEKNLGVLCKLVFQIHYCWYYADNWRIKILGTITSSTSRLKPFCYDLIRRWGNKTLYL